MEKVKKSLLEKLSMKPDGGMPWMLDLSLWYAWHAKLGTLPAQWADYSQVEVAHELGSPAWIPMKPWKAVHDGVDVVVDERADKRVVRYILHDRTLSASWTLGPDHDWWQMDHLITSPEDFKPAIELAEALNYELDRDCLLENGLGGEGLAVVIELPHRPLSALLHDFLGWGEGLLMLKDHQDQVDQLLAVLDEKIQALVDDLAELPGKVVLSPDNLDGQYISPDLFARYLTTSYSASCRRVHAAGKSFVVHAGGPMRRLLAPLAAAGVDVVEGVSGPPQSDVPLPEARKEAGAEIVLWGGIPQDWLLETTSPDEFRAGVERVINEVADDGNAILGVADRVPVAADVERLGLLSDMIDSIVR